MFLLPCSAVLGSLLHPVFAAALPSLKKRLWMNSGATFHFLSPSERSQVCYFWYCPSLKLSELLFGSHQSTLEGSHLILVPQTSKPNLFIILEGPSPLIPCSHIGPLFRDFACLVPLINCFPLHLQIFVTTFFCPLPWTAFHQKSPSYLQTLPRYHKGKFT